jgi:hypothetical protein
LEIGKAKREMGCSWLVLGAESKSKFIAQKTRDGAEYLASLGMTVIQSRDEKEGWG